MNCVSKSSEWISVRGCRATCPIMNRCAFWIIVKANVFSHSNARPKIVDYYIYTLHTCNYRTTVWFRTDSVKSSSVRQRKYYFDTADDKGVGTALVAATNIPSRSLGHHQSLRNANKPRLSRNGRRTFTILNVAVSIKQFTFSNLCTVLRTVVFFS